MENQPQPQSTVESGTSQAASSARIRVRNSGLPTTYANIVEVRAGNDEVMLTFGYGHPVRVQAEPGSSQSATTDLVVDHSQRMALSPRAAKRLAISLGQTLRQLEAQFGEIDLNPARPADSAPQASEGAPEPVTAES